MGLSDIIGEGPFVKSDGTEVSLEDVASNKVVLLYFSVSDTTLLLGVSFFSMCGWWCATHAPLQTGTLVSPVSPIHAHLGRVVPHRQGSWQGGRAYLCLL